MEEISIHLLPRLSNRIYICTWYEIYLCRQLSYLLCFCPPQIVTKSLPLILCILNLRIDKTDFACILLTIQFYTDIILTHTSIDSRISQTGLNVFPWNFVAEVTCSTEKGNEINLKVKQQEWCDSGFWLVSAKVCLWESSTVLQLVHLQKTQVLEVSPPGNPFFSPNTTPSLSFSGVHKQERSWCCLAVITHPDPRSFFHIYGARTVNTLLRYSEHTQLQDCEKTPFLKWIRMVDCNFNG